MRTGPGQPSDTCMDARACWYSPWCEASNLVNNSSPEEASVLGDDVSSSAKRACGDLKSWIPLPY